MSCNQNSLIIERGSEEDLTAINDIYNFYVRSSFATFETNEWTLQQRLLWFKEFELRHDLYNLFVAKIDNQVVGFAYNAKYKEKPAYITSSEVTVYLRQGASGSGIGGALYEALFSVVSNTQLHRLYAILALPNDASIRLHEKFGFVVIGQMDEVGFKYGQFYSTMILEKHINDS